VLVRPDRTVRQQLVLVTVATVGVGLAIQLGSAVGAHATSDIPKLWFERGIRLDAAPYLDRPLEYPPVIGLAMWATSWAGSRAAYLVVNAALLAPLAVAVTVMLERRGGRAARRWAAGVPLALYALHHWDLLAVAPAVAALLAAEAGAGGVAGGLLAVGASAKLYPALVAVLVAVLWLRAGRPDLVRRLLIGFAAVAVAINLPVLLAAPDGWWHAVEFQGDRPASWGSLWFHVFRLPGLREVVDPLAAGPANLASTLALLAGTAWLAVVVWRRSPGVFAIGTAATVLFVLASKVYSPQYDLWVLPAFALLPLDRRLFAAFSGVSLAMYLLVFGHGFGLVPQAALAECIGVVVVARALVLVGVLRAATA
jgi:uncharacterized membrane protein